MNASSATSPSQRDREEKCGLYFGLAMGLVIWLLEEMGLPYDRKDIGGKFGGNDTPEYRAMNPNGVVPADANDRTRRIEPSRLSVTVSIVLEAVFVTASAVPAGFSDTCAGPESPAASGAVPPISCCL